MDDKEIIERKREANKKFFEENKTKIALEIIPETRYELIEETTFDAFRGLYLIDNKVSFRDAENIMGITEEEYVYIKQHISYTNFDKQLYHHDIILRLLNYEKFSILDFKQFIDENYPIAFDEPLKLTPYKGNEIKLKLFKRTLTYRLTFFRPNQSRWELIE